MRRQELNSENRKIELSVRGITHLLHSFEADYGRDELVKFMDKTGLPLEYFQNEYNWVSYEYFCNMLELLVEYTKDKNIAYKYGLNTIKFPNSWGILKTILTFIPTPGYVYKTLAAITPRYSKLGRMNITKLKSNKAKCKFQNKPEYKQDKNNCLNLQGQLASIPGFFNLPFANVKELQCAAEGADSCVYEITWQNYPFKKNKIFSLLIVLFVVCIIYIIVKWNIISTTALANTALFLIPIAFYLGGHILDYKRTIKDNSEILLDQNKALIDSLNNTQQLNEELQIKIDQRTEELKSTNKQLAKTLLKLKESERKLVYAERMVGVANLAAGVAHEVNNPMGAVRNYLQEILEDMPENDKRKKDIIEAEKATGESKVLINDLLSFARTDNNLYIVEIDINEVIEKITASVRQSFLHTNVKISKDLMPDLPIVKLDPMQIDQVFTNLITNAYTAVKGNGEICIKTSDGSDGIHVEIKDNGEIIPQDIINKIFDPSEKALNGIGRKDIGLAISYSIIKRFNGEIKVASSGKEGTKFDIVIPYALR